MKIVDRNEISKRALVLFRDGVLKRAVWLPEYYKVVPSEICADGLWLRSERDGFFSLDSSGLSLIASETKDFALKDATDWAKAKLEVSGH